MQKDLGRLDLAAAVRVPKRGRLHEVDSPAEEGLQIGEEAEVGVGVILRRRRRELHEEVEVAPLGIEVIANGRPEQGQPLHGVARHSSPIFSRWPSTTMSIGLSPWRSLGTIIGCLGRT